MTTPTHHRSSIKSHGTLLAEQRQRIALMSQSELRKLRDAEALARQAEEARQRMVGYRTASRPDSAALVKYTRERGMSIASMHRIWGRTFVAAVLGDQI